MVDILQNPHEKRVARKDVFDAWSSDGVQSTLAKDLRDKKPTGLEETYFVSSVAPSTQSSPPYTPSKPVLPAPPTASGNTSSPMARLFKVLEAFGNSRNAYLRAQATHIGTLGKQADTTGQNQVKKAAIAEERALTYQSWSALTKIVTAVSTAVLSGLGFFLAGDGTQMIAATALFASAFTSLSLFACARAGVLDGVADKLSQGDEELKKKIKQLLPVALNIVVIGLGLYGGSAAPALTIDFLSKRAAYLLQSSAAALKGVTSIGEAIAEGNSLRSKADLILANQEFAEVRFYIQDIAKSTEHYLVVSKNFQQEFSQMVKMIIAANVQMLQE